MVAVLLSAFLGPGVGQLYNKEYRKGCILLVAGLVLVVIMAIKLSSSMMEYVNLDAANMDVTQLAQLGDKIGMELSPNRSPLMMACYLLTTVLWIYSMIDAWFGAKRRAQREAILKREASTK